MKIKQVFDLQHKRSILQALTFFVVYGVISFLVYALFAFPLCWSAATYQESYDCAYSVAGNAGKLIIASLFFILMLLIVYTRNINVFAKGSLIILSTIVGFVFGILPALIITTFTTMIPTKQV